jgi:hypothetical protein
VHGNFIINIFPREGDENPTFHNAGKVMKWDVGTQDRSYELTIALTTRELPRRFRVAKCKKDFRMHHKIGPQKKNTEILQEI